MPACISQYAASGTVPLAPAAEPTLFDSEEHPPMDKRVANRQYGYLTPETDKAVVNMLRGQHISGYSVGVVYIEDVFYPVVPGNICNAYTFDLHVRRRAVPTWGSSAFSMPIRPSLMIWSNSARIWCRKRVSARCR